MSLGKELGDFKFKITSVSQSEDWSSISADCDGTGTGFGTVLGTIHFKGAAGEKQGMCSWRGQGFLDDGNEVTATGEGVWQSSGKHRWRIRSIHLISNGEVIATDGELDLASRSFEGKIYDAD